MKIHLVVAGLICMSSSLFAQKYVANYDEAKVPTYTLPDLLTTENGKKISSSKEWETIRRPEILSVFEQQVYGVTPQEKVKTTYRILEESTDALNGKATRKQIEITFSNQGIQRKALMLIYIPNSIKGKVPLFFAYNYWGNQVICKDNAIIPTSEKENGCRTNRWPVPMIIDSGYGIATILYEQIYLDNKENGREPSILTLFGEKNPANLAPNDCQAIGAWAWGMSRAMDYFEQDKRIDTSKIILMGHSRQGKAALWAGAQDHRFAIIISNCSGCGGAALSRRAFGETVAIITTAFPHWFCKNFTKYANNEHQLPVDQHQLIALIAPRPVYVVSAAEDLWADPKGEFLSALMAGEVYELYGYKGLEQKEQPELNEPIMNRVGYHIRTGIHDVTEYDWKQYIRFANKWLKE